MYGRTTRRDAQRRRDVDMCCWRKSELKQATLIWLPLFVGVGGTGASKQKNSWWREACDLLQHSAQLLVLIQSTFQLQAKEKGLLTLDAPVSGGVIGADQGTLTFMVGGTSKTYNDMKFLFEIMGKNCILCGEEGSGQSAKICNNMLLASTMIAVGESFNLGKNLGLDLNKLFDVISTSTGSCWAVNSYCPIKGIGPNSPADKDYTGGFATALMYKDLGLAVDAATETKTNINYGMQTFEKYKQVTINGKGNLDFSNIINE